MVRKTIVATEFEPDKAFGSGTLKPIDYMVELADLGITPSRRAKVIYAVKLILTEQLMAYFYQ